MVFHIADAMNLQSAETKARIGRNINIRYKRITSSIGLITSRRVEVPEDVTAGSRFVTFSGIEKIDTVFYINDNKNIILDELTHDEMLATTIRTWPPQAFSVFSTTTNTVTIMLDCEPGVDDDVTLFAHGLADASTLTGTDSPAIPESFHDILIHGAMADEYKRMEKKDYATDCERLFNDRVSDLRLFIAKSGYLTIYPGKHSKPDDWWDTRAKPNN